MADRQLQMNISWRLNCVCLLTAAPLQWPVERVTLKAWLTHPVSFFVFTHLLTSKYLSRCLQWCSSAAHVQNWRHGLWSTWQRVRHALAFLLKSETCRFYNFYFLAYVWILPDSIKNSFFFSSTVGIGRENWKGILTLMEKLLKKECNTSRDRIQAERFLQCAFDLLIDWYLHGRFVPCQMYAW